MKLVSNRFAILCVVLGLASFLNFSAQAQLTTISDSTGDIDAGISTGGGTLDSVKMEVGDTATDVVFKLTVNGSIATTDWGNFMIGIANQKAAGTTTRNGWNRPINLDAGVTSGVTYGMTHWIGSWVNAGGGAQVWTPNGASWTQSAAPGFSLLAGAQSVITYTVPKDTLGVVNGDTIKFDAYSSGGGVNDSAVDALANPNTSITAWGGPYTSSASTGLASYTLANTMLNTTQSITFSANMNHQILLGAFNPATDKVSVDWGAGFPQANVQYLTDGDSDGIYTGSATISAPGGASVPYRFTIEPVEPALLVSETVSRSFSMPNAATTVSSSYFNNIEGYRDVTFSVNMSVQQTLGNFIPATQTVEVRGPFNAWEGTVLTDQGEGVYSGTVRVSGAAAGTPYKFFAGGYEAGSNRSFTLAFNSDRAPTPSQVLDTVFYSNVNTVPDFRPVTFAVDMGVQSQLGNFVLETDKVYLVGEVTDWGTGTEMVREGETSVYKLTLAVSGAAGSTRQYKFKSGATGAANSGYENDLDSVVVDDQARVLMLGAADVAQNLSTVFFSNLSVLPPSALSYTPSSASGTVDTAISSLTPTVTGTVTSYSVSPTLPAGLSISTSTGVISGTPTAVSASASYTVTATNGTGSTTATVTIEVVAAANPLAAYVESFGLSGGDAAGDADPDGDGQNNSAEYAFGTDPKSSASRPITLISSTGEIKLVYLQRNTGVSYSVKSFTDLATSFDSGTTVTPVATSPQPADVRTGYTQYEAALSTAGIPKGFLRVQATLAP